MNTGQMFEDIRRNVPNEIPVDFYGRLGGMAPFPDEIYNEILRVANDPVSQGVDPRLAWIDRLKQITYI
jgi:2-oxoglutarate ferredoxin oxidoreductase subunit alpha